ncbi:hypothetical protein GCM10022402_43680 [Salinactinospora qingdaonensis]|uniref:Acyl-CoA synthetase (AMP-forming)/AMP-acid ligase II n=1 Tax=Salinactinospora qingdaonensis TaxID=702744 RepID=A0ABP7GDK6_9ACTN
MSSNGVVLADQVPAALRRAWVTQGHCPDRDTFSLFSEHAAAHPARPAVIDTEGTLDYAALDAVARRIALALLAAGLGPTDIVAIQVPNGRRAVAAELAVAAIGALALPYPCGRGRSDSLALLGRSRASAVIAADRAGELRPAAELAALRDHLPHLREILVFGAAPPGCRRLPEEDTLPGWQPAAVDAEAPARVLVSSGSEAEPKMVAYSHNAMCGGRGNYIGALHGGAEPMRALLLAPLASSYGSCGSVTLARHGGTLLVLDVFDPAAALEMIERHGPTHVYGVPTMLSRIAALAGPGGVAHPPRAVVASGAALHAETAASCRDRFGCPVINVYGSADGVNCHTGADESAVAEGVVGHPDPAVAEIAVTGPDGEPLPEGREGEIRARGPMTPLCYVNAPELDARYRTSGGWVRTGDRGVLLSDGALRVVDRIKRVVIRGGYNISPLEVERHISTHPDVADVSCVAVPDAELGERLCACVAQPPAAAPLTLPDLTDYLERQRGLERRKLPEKLLVLPELPLGPTGKVCRHTLADLASGAATASATPHAQPIRQGGRP